MNNQPASTASTSADPQVLITRIFNAPRELVFKAWTDVKHLQHWYAPKDCTVEFFKLDVRPGGVFHHCIHNPSYGPCIVSGVYQEVQAPERIVMTLFLADRDGNVVETTATNHDPEWPNLMLLTLTFEDLGGGKTKFTLHQNVSERLAKKTGAYPSWLQMLDKLEAELAASHA